MIVRLWSFILRPSSALFFPRTNVLFLLDTAQMFVYNWDTWETNVLIWDNWDKR